MKLQYNLGKLSIKLELGSYCVYFIYKRFPESKLSNFLLSLGINLKFKKKYLDIQVKNLNEYMTKI